MRDHIPVTVDQFNGLWRRGDPETCPIDHFTDCDNIQFQEGAFKTRDGIDPFAAYPNVVRIYTYNQPSVQSLLLLDDSGNIYHTESPTPLTPILSIPGMLDFAFVAINGRAYITPNDRVTGLDGDFLYVYLGDGTPARKAAGDGPIGGTFTAATSATAGNVEPGYHIFGVMYETNSGFITKIGTVKSALNVLVATKKVDLTNIPLSPDAFVIARYIVATRAIDPTLYTGNVEGYEFFFVPDGRIEDNTTTILTVNFYDADLLESANDYLDLLSEIPATVNLCTYHGRLVTMAEYGEETGDFLTSTIGDISLARLSLSGQPEAFDELTGLIIAPLDSKPLTNGQEYRDVLYLFKQTKTLAYNDNGDVPSSWEVTIVDEGTGAPIHGLAHVLDSGGVNIEFLIIADWSGVMIFDGKFSRPGGELTWKIADLWHEIDRGDFYLIHMLNDSINQRLYIVLPDGTMLLGDYDDGGLDPKTIKWTPWSFEVNIMAIALVNTNTLILASDGEV